MAVQFAGSGSTGDRRRRRLVANRDDVSVDAAIADGDGAEMESQLLGSAAAAPWVPRTEMRIWIYAAAVGLGLAGLIFALARPAAFHADLIPLSNHLLEGSRPVLVVFTQTLFLSLSAQLAMLIGWYRARCKLDFGGRYRVWPWAVGLFVAAAFCAATNSHIAFGEVVGHNRFLTWRGTTVSWLLPFCVAGLPITILLDRDMRNSRSSLFMLRLSVLLGLTGTCFELFQPELQSKAWFQSTFQVIPLLASATLFIGLWLHARIVAYVSPDPPVLEERSATDLLLVAFSWIGRRLMFWVRRDSSESDDDETKPKRRRKKTAVDEAPTTRKKKAPARRTPARARTRVKSEGEEDSGELPNTDESKPTDQDADDQPSEASSNWDSDQEDWNESRVPASSNNSPASTRSNVNGRFTKVDEGHASVPAPPSRRHLSSWQEVSNSNDEVTNSANDSNEDSDEDRQFQLDSGMTADQMKGMSKRQKRELRKQMRDQQRARGG